MRRRFAIILTHSQFKFNALKVWKELDNPIGFDNKPFYMIPIHILDDSQPTADAVNLKTHTAFFCERSAKVTPSVAFLGLRTD